MGNVPDQPSSIRRQIPPNVKPEVAEQLTIWSLQPDWGHPRGPNGKLRLVSRCSVAAAANRVALSEKDALNMNLHVGSWAPAFPRQVEREAFLKLWYHPNGSYIWHNPWKDVWVRVFDLRHLSRIDRGQDLWDRAIGASLPHRPLSEHEEQIANAGNSVRTPDVEMSPPLDETLLSARSNQELSNQELSNQELSNQELPHQHARPGFFAQLANEQFLAQDYAYESEVSVYRDPNLDRHT